LLSKKVVLTALAAVSVGNAVAAEVNAIPGWAVTDAAIVISYAAVITYLGGLPAKRAVARKTERPLRKMLGHAIRRELDDLDSLIQASEDQMPRAAELCALATAYTAIDVCERWPLDVDLCELARRAAQSMTRLPVTDDEIYTYLSRVVFGLEHLADVFTDQERADRVPLFTTASLLLSFCPGNLEWWKYLDQIWDAVETGGRTKSAVLPALMYRVRAEAAHAARQPAGKDAQISELETGLGRSDEDCGKLIAVVTRQYDRIDRLETENDQLKAEIAQLEAEKKRPAEQP
jgi:hypothetical protein